MSDESLVAFARSLSDAARGGLPLAARLRELEAHHGAGLGAAADKVAAGAALHESLGPAWPPLLLALVRAGEESGKLDIFLDRYADRLETRLAFRRRLARAALYPAFGLLLASALFIVFSAKAAPLLFQPLIDAGVPPPEGALRVVETGRFILDNVWLVLGGLFASWLLLRAALSSRPASRLWALAGHILPGARYALAEGRHQRVASTLSLLLSAGLRPRQTLELLAQDFADDPVLSRRLAAASSRLTEGASYAELLRDCLPAEDAARLSVAEQAGRLDAALEDLSKTHGERHTHRLRVLSTVFQLGSVCLLAPVAFGLAYWVLAPSLSLLKNAAGLAPQAAPLYRSDGEPRRGGSLDVPPPPAFNETRAKNVVDYMETHGAKPEKPVPKPKLKTRASGRFEPTPIESGFSR